MSKLRLLRILPPIALGVGVAAWLISQSEPPQRVEQAERRLAARTAILAETPVRPVVEGYGTAAPAQSWQAVAEVAGTVIYRHPKLETGNLISAGTTVLRIDPERYQASAAQARADLAALRAERDQLATEAANTRALLALEERRLGFAEGDLERVRNLLAQGAAAQARLDEQERSTLQTRRSVQELRNSLALIPARDARLGAQIARAEAALWRAETDLARTEFTTPFDLRVGAVQVEQHQYVPAGQPLVSGDGVARVEVTAQLPIASFPRLIGAVRADANEGIAVLRTALDQIEARLSLVSDPSQSWEGRVLRVANALDPQARSVPVVIAVDDPYGGANPPVRLPLVPNMYLRVTLTGPEGAPHITLPAEALHEGRQVYLRDDDGRLALREVEVGWQQQGRAVILSGLAPGEEVILDDLVPAIPGMLVDPVPVRQ